MRHTALLALLAATNCTIDVEVPVGARIRCSSNTDCPEPLVCSEAAQMCVNRADEEPPTIESVEVTVVGRDPSGPKLAALGDQIEIRVTVDEPLLEPPGVTLLWTELAARAAEVTGGSGDDLSWTLRETIELGDDATATELEGFVSVRVSVTDRAGLGAELELPREIEVDLTPPRIDDNTVAVLYFPDIGRNPLTQVSAASQGTTVQVAFAVDEPLALDPVLAAVGPSTISITNQVAKVGTFYTYELEIPDTLADGAYPIEVDLEDLAGNRVSAADGNAATAPSLTFTVDRTPPPSPDVATDGLIVYTRVPWGDDSTRDGSTLHRLFSVEGAALAMTPRAILQVLDGGDPDTALEIGRTRARDSGSFGARVAGDEVLSGEPPDGVDLSADPTAALSLNAADRDAIWVAEVDNAGNRSPLVRVRNVTWIATTGFREKGLDRTNPNVIYQQPQTTSALRTSTRFEADNPPRFAAVDGFPTEPVIAEKVWKLRIPGSAGYGPSATAATVTATGEVLLYGGLTGDTSLLRWDGDEWRAVGVGGVQPTARVWNGMAYDSARDRLVITGGVVGLSTGLDDVWEWTGSEWLELTPSAGSPSPGFRALVALVYDPIREESILFGGLGEEMENGECADGALILEGAFCTRGDTWRWDGQSWTELCNENTCGVPSRFGHSMAFDPARAQIVMYGGCRPTGGSLDCTGALFDDTWIWNGATWTQASPTSAPLARLSHSMVWAEDLGGGAGGVVVYGGCVSGDVMECTAASSEMWRWDGSDWSCIGRSTASGSCPDGGASWPLARSAAPIAWDGEDGHLLMLGGQGYTNNADECTDNFGIPEDVSGSPTECQFGGTWWWDPLVPIAGSWKRVVGPEVSDLRPTRARNAAAAWDPTSNTLARFGGRSDESDCDGSGAQECGSLWEWNGFAWRQLFLPAAQPTAGQASAPLARTDTTLVGTGDGLILFGGTRGGDCWEGSLTSPFCEDTWRWNGVNTWIRISDSTGPQPRDKAMAAYDFERERVVLFGGRGPGDILADCSTDQFFVETATGTACFYCDTWELDASSGAWTRAAIDTGTNCDATVMPQARASGVMAYDSALDAVVLYGGCPDTADQCENGLSDVWSWNGSAWTELVSDAAPPGRRGQGVMVYDSWRGMLVLDSGRRDPALDPTWEWNGTLWREQLTRGSRPSADDGHSAIYDEARERMIVVNVATESPVWELDLSPERKPSMVFAVGWYAATQTLTEQVAPVELNVRGEITGHGYTTPLVPPSSHGTPTSVDGVRLEGWNRQTQSWQPLMAPECTDGATTTLDATLDPASYVSGSPARIYLRFSPCGADGISITPAELDLDYVSATVRYRLP